MTTLLAHRFLQNIADQHAQGGGDSAVSAQMMAIEIDAHFR